MSGSSGKAPIILVVCGSTRKVSFTRFVMACLIEGLERSNNIQVDKLELRGISVSNLGDNFVPEIANNIRKRVKESSAVIICTPEYNGCFSSSIMALIENLGYPAIYSGKVFSLLGVASGSIGAIKSLEHLKAVLSHNGAIVLPNSVSIANINEHFDENGVCNNAKIKQQITSVGFSLIEFITHGKISQVGTKIINDN